MDVSAADSTLHKRPPDFHHVYLEGWKVMCSKGCRGIRDVHVSQPNVAHF